MASQGDPCQPVVLLGAGASVEAGIPASFPMTEKISVWLSSGPDRLKSAYRLISGGLLMGSGPTEGTGVDIEQVLNVSEMLSRRSRIELAPFVAAWHPLIEALERPAPPDGIPWRFAKELERLIPRPNQSGNPYPPQIETGLIRSILDELIAGLTPGPGGHVFRELSENIAAALVSIAWLPPADESIRNRVAYLNPLATAAANAPLTVATLNYDNVVERCAESLGVPVTTGMDQWLKERSTDASEVGIDLMKLHGSIDWIWTNRTPAAGLRFDSQEVKAPISIQPDEEMERIRQVRSGFFTREVGRRLAIVFGGENKLTARGPFLDLLMKFKGCLRKTSHLVTVGYSFRDDHVNRIVEDWLTMRSDARVTAIDRVPDKDGHEWDRHHSYFYSRFLPQIHHRFSLLPLGAGPGLSQVFGQGQEVAGPVKSL